MFGVGRYFAKVPKPEVAYFVGSELFEMKATLLPKLHSARE